MDRLSGHVEYMMLILHKHDLVDSRPSVTGVNSILSYHIIYSFKRTLTKHKVKTI